MILKLFITLFVAATAFVAYKIVYFEPYKLPDIPKTGYFGKGPKREDDQSINKFTISVSNATLLDLHRRLENARWYDSLEDAKFHYGFNTAYLKEVHNYWLTKYNWPRIEAELNAFNHYHTEIEGIKVHFIHAKPQAGTYKKTVPLLIVHGWPGSVYEFYKLIPMLTDPKKHGLGDDIAFEVVAPSIPGYGWSEAPSKQGFNPPAAGRVFNKLMSRLNFKRYYTQGGDWGAVITQIMALMYPARILGAHLNMGMMFPAAHPMLALKMAFGTICPSCVLPEHEVHKIYPMGAKYLDLLKESGYMHIQATKPDTVGFALNDSPMGLASYILEKFSTWTKRSNRDAEDGNLTKKFTLDELLTNIMIYWTTGSIASSQRFYKECFSDPDFQMISAIPVTVPLGYACFNDDLGVMPEAWIHYQFTNVVQYTEMPRGGHFPALEEPQLMAKDIHSFVKKVL